MNAPIPAPLAARLRAETGALHQQVERSTYMQALLAGRLDRHGYGLLLRNLHLVYTALESALAQHAHHAAIAPIFSPALCRTAALERDLAWLFGDRWRGDLAVLPAATAYVDRLLGLAASRPSLLVAHAYVRYLGDLSGGQLLQRIVVRSLGLAAPTDEAGTGGIDFYDFGPPAEVARLARAFRAGLDTAAADRADIDAIVGEALRAFEMHGTLFDALAVACRLPPPGRATAP